MTAKARENRVQEVSALSRGLKLLARDFKVPFLVLSQLSRAVESRDSHKPQLSDLRDSGGIEQDADLVAFVYRPEVYAETKEQVAALFGQAELLIAKQRNGPIGVVKLTFLHSYTRFEDRAEREAE
jgi:replicative DNA helicase